MPVPQVPPIDDAAMLSAWERASPFPRPWREVALLAAVCGEPADAVARIPLGRRDAALLAIRERTFGRRLDCETACPACGARLELTLDVAEIRRAPPEIRPSDLEIEDDGFTATFRLPDSTDVAACRRAADDAETTLLARCVTSAIRGDEALTVAALSASLRERLAARMAELDPQADTTLDLTCPSCVHRWQAGFDPAGFFLAEVDAWADRVMREVDQLARAYGWTEAEVLAVPRARRRRYLELVLR